MNRTNPCVDSESAKCRHSGLFCMALDQLRAFSNHVPGTHLAHNRRLRLKHSNGGPMKEALPGNAMLERHLATANTEPNSKLSLRFRVGKQWLLLPVGIGIGYWLYAKWSQERKPIEQEKLTVWPQWKLRTYYTLPLNGVSRVWGRLNTMVVPESWRERYLGWWVGFLGCDMAEVVEPDLTQYSNLSELFNRRLKPELRPIENAELVSPADGKIVGFGLIENEVLEQIKGLNFKLGEFIGPDTREKLIDALRDKKTRLYYLTVYLGPKDYHAFHSPTKWTVQTRRHFGGKLMGVHPNILQQVPGVFIFNERVLLVGEWHHGFFSFTAVGAMNVGKIHIDCDEELVTNLKHISKSKRIVDKHFQDVVFHAGDRVGEFRLGSSVVLIFEAPVDFEFHVNPGQDIKYGQLLGGKQV